MESASLLSLPPPTADDRIPYGPQPAQFGDLRLPSGRGPHPLLIFVHGGYWRARYDLEHTGFLCAAFASAGIASWNMEYRRLGEPGGGWPGTFLDVARGVRHVVSLSIRYPLDPQRVALAGHSAGGQLALWAAGARQLPPDSPLHLPDPLPLCAVVALAPVSDLVRAWELRLSEGVVEQLLGGTPYEHPGRYAAASPFALLPLGLRQVLIHGSEDIDVPFELSARYCQAAAALGDDVTLLPLPGAGHFEPIDPSSGAFPAVFTTVSQALGSPAEA